LRRERRDGEAEGDRAGAKDASHRRGW
jgi:hypothetical protein